MEESKSVKTRIYVIGDIHVGKDEIYSQKSKFISSIIDKVKNEPESMVILTGDLTENGSGYGKLCCFSCINNCSGSNQTEAFINNVYKPLIKANKNIYMCHGNHDESTDNLTYPIVDFIQDTYGADKKGCYYFIHNNICFVCLGKYPDADALKFYSMVINRTEDKYPYVLFYHYNMYGPYSDFWTDNEKTVFTNFIDKKNIICILTGHIHDTFMSYIETPESKKINFCGSGMFSYTCIDIVDDKISEFSHLT